MRVPVFSVYLAHYEVSMQMAKGEALAPQQSNSLNKLQADLAAENSGWVAHLRLREAESVLNRKKVSTSSC